MPNLKAAGSADARIIWARSAIAWAERTADIARLIDLADGKEQVGDFTFDQEMRWAIAIKAVAFGVPGAQERSPPRPGATSQIAAAARCSGPRLRAPTREAKDAPGSSIHGDGYGSFHLTRAAMQGFFWPHQAELVEPYVDRFFDQRARGLRDARPPVRPLVPAVPLPGLPRRSACARSLRAAADDLDGQLPTLSRQLAEVADELERAIRVRRFAES